MHNRKRILVLPAVFLPHNETITQISYKILCNLDYEIDVVSFKSSSDEYFEEYIKKDKKFKKMNIYYIDVDWKRLDINSKNYNLLKMKKYLHQYTKLAKELASKNKYDYVFSFSVPNYTHMVAYKIKKMNKNIKWFASFSDPIYNNIYVEQLKQERFKAKILYVLLRLMYYKYKYQIVPLKYADKLIFMSDALKKYITNNNKEYVDKSIVYPITYDKKWINYKKLISISSKKNRSKNGKIVFAHFGNIYGLRKIDKFLVAMDELIEENREIENRIEIHQYGSIDNNQLNSIKEKERNYLYIHNRVSYDKCIDIMGKADVLLIFDTIVSKDNIQPFLPSKITDYLLTNKPIFAITLKNSPLYDIINKKHICVDYDTNLIKKGIIKQLNNVNSVHNNIEDFDNDYVSSQVFKGLLDIIDLEEEEK